MKLKFGINIFLISLGICLSLTDDIKSNTTSISTFSRESRAIQFVAAATSAFRLVTTAVTVINEITSLVTGMDSLIDLIKNDKSDEIFQENVMKKLNDIHGICMKIDGMEKKIDRLNDVMKENTDRIVKTVEFNHAREIVDRFQKHLDYVNNIYHKQFVEVWNKMNSYQLRSVSDHLHKVVDNTAFGEQLPAMISDIIASLNSQSSIFKSRSQYYDTQNGYRFECENISPLDHLHVFYGNIILTFARGYTMLLLSYEYFKRNEDFAFNQDRQNAAFKQFKEDIEVITKHAKSDFNSISDSNYRASYSCDSSEWTEGRNFIRVKNYISVQSYQSHWGNHVNDPAAVAKSNEYDCPNGWAEYQRVTDAENDTLSHICTAPFNPDLKNPYSVEYEELRSPMARKWEIRRCGLGTTNYIYRICDHDHDSDTILSIRKLSLRVQECDTTKNEVVTDAVFSEKDRKIYIKLRCGVLKEGQIDLNTLRWTEDNERYSENRPKEYVVLSSKLKSFNLDNVILPFGVLVTGVGFKVVDDHFISLVVRGNEVHNYNNGNYFERYSSKEYSSPKSDKPRESINISRLERPLRRMGQTYDMSKAGKSFINLTLSKWSDEYNNEAIVPYFDMTAYGEENSRISASPLGGLGLFYKSLPGFTGFLAFKHLSPTYLQFVDTDSISQLTLDEARNPSSKWNFFTKQ